jgi:hypothetical protein
MTHTWNVDRAGDHIDKKIADVETVEILDYKRELSLENIRTNRAYRVAGVHLYVDILNVDEMLDAAVEESVRVHQRLLRFLNLQYRAFDRILNSTAVRRVDFQNQRLHALVTQPYGADQAAARVHKAVAVAQLAIDVLDQTADAEQQLPNAKVRVGIDTGETLAVNNGRNGGREPLFLGDAANHGAKMACGGSAKGIFLTNNARVAIGLDEVDHPKRSPLTAAEIVISQEAAKLDLTVESVVEQWHADLKRNPLGAVSFSGHTPPLRTLDIAALTLANSRRQDAVSLYADLDGFTAFVARHIDDRPEDVVRVLHVVRAELDRVLVQEFDGRRIRFIGDCIHGIMCEGTAQTTDAEASVTDATLCAAALRSSFDLALEKLKAEGIDVYGLGLQIGFEYGPVTVTRMGLHGDRVRCSISRAVLASEAEQGRCEAAETAIGEKAYGLASKGVRDLFVDDRKVEACDYAEAVDALTESGDDKGRAAQEAAFVAAAPAVAAGASTVVRPYAQRD